MIVKVRSGTMRGDPDLKPLAPAYLRDLSIADVQYRQSG